MRILRVDWEEGQLNLSLNFRKVQRQTGREGMVLWACRKTCEPLGGQQCPLRSVWSKPMPLQSRVVAFLLRARTTLVVCCRHRRSKEIM